MNTQEISYSELATLPRAPHEIAVFRAFLSIIPGIGCRLFVYYKRQSLSVVGEDGQPTFFRSVEMALTELASLPGIDHQVTVDLISMLPRAYDRNFTPGETEKDAAHVL